MVGELKVRRCASLAESSETLMHMKGRIRRSFEQGHVLGAHATSARRLVAAQGVTRSEWKAKSISARRFSIVLKRDDEWPYHILRESDVNPLTGGGPDI
jgi:hypothetical protein